MFLISQLWEREQYFLNVGGKNGLEAVNRLELISNKLKKNELLDLKEKEFVYFLLLERRNEFLDMLDFYMRENNVIKAQEKQEAVKKIDKIISSLF